MTTKPKWSPAKLILSLLAVVALILAATVGPVPGLVLLFILAVALLTAVVSVPLRLISSFREGSEVGAEGVASPGLSRRQAIKRLGLGSAVAVVPAMSLPTLLDSFKLEAVAELATGPGGRVRQWGMLIDLRLCDGCQSQGTPPQCTTSCIEGHFVPEPMQWIETYEAHLEGGGTQFIPTPCQQCQSPPCVNVCPVTATFSTPEGPVLIDQERCIGCRMCMAACPYDRRFFNWGEPPIPPEALLADYSVEHQTPAQKGTVMKCDFCPEMARSGTLPFCVQACPNDALYYGDLEEDLATNGREIVSFHEHLAENNSFRLRPELGTEPRVHYIPGHGELVGRDRHTEGRLPTRWPWVERVKGAVTWGR